MLDNKQTIPNSEINASVCPPGLLETFQRCGRALFHGGLNNSHSGNLSVYDGTTIWITRTGAMLHELGPLDMVGTSLVPAEGVRPRLSAEFIVHAGIYAALGHKAVVHCHPLWSVALGMVEDEIIPLQIDGYGLLPGRIPVLEVSNASGSPELTKAVVALLSDVPAVVVRGHGTFVVGSDLEQATHRSFVVENSSQIICTVRGLGGDLSELRTRPYVVSGY